MLEQRFPDSLILEWQQLVPPPGLKWQSDPPHFPQLLRQQTLPKHKPASAPDDTSSADTGAGACLRGDTGSGVDASSASEGGSESASVAGSGSGAFGSSLCTSITGRSAKASATTRGVILSGMRPPWNGFDTAQKARPVQPVFGHSPTSSEAVWHISTFDASPVYATASKLPVSPGAQFGWYEPPSGTPPLILTNEHEKKSGN